jgi:AcrR family transcriptional regulator
MVKKINSKLRGRPKDESKASAILEAATKQFIVGGMARTTMQDIATMAGVSKITVYNNFGTKEELFQRVIQNKCTKYMSDDMLKKALSQTAYEGLCTLGMAFVGIIYDDGALAMHRTVMAQSVCDPELAQLFYRNGPERVFSLMNVYLKHIEGEGDCSFDNIQRASEVFISLFTGDTYMKALLEIESKPGQERLETFTRENVDFFFRIFRT